MTDSLIHPLACKALRNCALPLVFTTSCFAGTPDACQAIHDATIATLNVPGGLRQYASPREGAAERLVSVITADAVYVAISPGHWSRESRAAQRADAAEAEGMKKLSGCRPAGAASLGGEQVTMFEYTVQFHGLAAIGAKVWIGADGLLRKQSTAGRGFVRYEYKDIHPPAQVGGKNA